MPILIGFFLGFLLWFLARVLLAGIYTVNQHERAVKTSFGRADRLPEEYLQENTWIPVPDSEANEQEALPNTLECAQEAVGKWRSFRDDSYQEVEDIVLAEHQREWLGCVPKKMEDHRCTWRTGQHELRIVPFVATQMIPLRHRRLTRG